MGLFTVVHKLNTVLCWAEDCKSGCKNLREISPMLPIVPCSLYFFILEFGDGHTNQALGLMFHIKRWR